jgi:hypothetical protein
MQLQWRARTAAEIRDETVSGRDEPAMCGAIFADLQALHVGSGQLRL